MSENGVLCPAPSRAWMWKAFSCRFSAEDGCEEQEARWVQGCPELRGLCRRVEGQHCLFPGVPIRRCPHQPKDHHGSTELKQMDFSWACRERAAGLLWKAGLNLLCFSSPDLWWHIFKCPGLYRCEPELTSHPFFCCSDSQRCCPFLISRVFQCCFSHSHWKALAAFPWFAVNTGLKQLLAVLGQLLPKLTRELCCLMWLITFPSIFTTAAPQFLSVLEWEKPGIRNLLTITCTNFLERLKPRNPQLNFIYWHSLGTVSECTSLLQFISVIDLQSFLKALPSYFGCHHQYFLQKLDMRNSKRAVYMWIMISLSSNTKSFPIALVEIVQWFHIYKRG